MLITVNKNFHIYWLVYHLLINKYMLSDIGGVLSIFYGVFLSDICKNFMNLRGKTESFFNLEFLENNDWLW